MNTPTNDPKIVMGSGPDPSSWPPPPLSQLDHRTEPAHRPTPVEMFRFFLSRFVGYGLVSGIAYGSIVGVFLFVIGAIYGFTIGGFSGLVLGLAEGLTIGGWAALIHARNAPWER